jgi:hypothetical protein
VELTTICRALPGELLSAAPADINACRVSERLPEQSDKVFRRPAVGDHVDRPRFDVVVLILCGFLFERIGEHFVIDPSNWFVAWL